MPATNTPLRYPGGKSQTSGVVTSIIRDNGLISGDYAEPFAGGAGVACSLLLKNIVNNIHLNDLDKSIYSFWQSAIFQTEAFCRMIEDTPVTIEEWHRQKEIKESTTNELQLGFSTFYLNRTNRSGIIRGGVIGGKDQSGNYKLDCRFNKKNLINKIEKLSAQRDRIKLHNLDAVRFIEEVLPTIPRNSLVNIDPPYFKKGPALYENHFQPEDHIQLAQKISKIEQRWLVTYDNAPEIQSLYKNYPCTNWSLNYSAQKKCREFELFIFDPRLIIPKIFIDITNQ